MDKWEFQAGEIRPGASRKVVHCPVIEVGLIYSTSAIPIATWRVTSLNPFKAEYCTKAGWRPSTVTREAFQDWLNNNDLFDLFKHTAVELLTEKELKAIELLMDFSYLVADIIEEGGNCEADSREAFDKIHVLEAMIAQQAAARTYPRKFRLLGEDNECLN
jgi:hypothetical protein